MNLGFLIAILLSGPVTDVVADQPTIIHLQDAKIWISPEQRVRMFSSEGSQTIQIVIDEEGRPGTVSIVAERLRLEHAGKISELSASGGRLVLKTHDAPAKTPETDKQ
jgi:hypothetical protein